MNLARNCNCISDSDFYDSSTGVHKHWRGPGSKIAIDGIYMVIRRTWNMTREMGIIYRSFRVSKKQKGEEVVEAFLYVVGKYFISVTHLGNI